MDMPAPSSTRNERVAAAAPAAPPMIRTPDQRVRVFVSSTLDELASECTAAREAIAQLRLTPILFESGARPYPPRELYRAYLAQSDIFVGLYWQRYGWVAPSMPVSGLKDEYQRAGEKPKLIYVKMPAPAREPRLEVLLNHIRAEGGVSFQKFATADELRERLANDLAQLLTERFTSLAETAGRGRPTSPPPLPATLLVPRSRLIDREHEVSLVRDLVQQTDVGLVTLTGPGGVGKKRLTIQVAAELAPQFADGVAFVSLAALNDPDFVEPAVAHALRISAARGSSIGERLQKYLRPRQLLLVLDNTGRLLSAVAVVGTRLLDAAQRLKLLVTSREPLRVHDERVVPLSPLALPDPVRLPDLGTLAQVPAVALFVQRVREVQPDLALTADNAQPVAEICRRVDGLPLALELAAARSNVLPLSVLSARLEHRLPLLTQGTRDAPARQQTLRNTIAWSYDLLDEGDKALFRRLAVFVGGFTLEAAATVCAFDADGESVSTSSAGDVGAVGASDDDGAVLEQLAQLLDKSLVQSQHSPGGEPRFTMLETIHEFAQEQLGSSSEADAVYRRHARYFLSLAEEADPHMLGQERDVWLERLDRENANLRAALAWSRADKDDQKTGQTGLRLVGALTSYWMLRDAIHEGRSWLEAMLERCNEADRSVARGRALASAGWLAWADGDYAAAAPRAEESLSILREMGDKRERAYTEWLLGLVWVGQHNTAAALALLKGSHTVLKELGDVRGDAITLYLLGMAAYFSADRRAARAYYEDSLRLFQEQEDVFGVALLTSALDVMDLAQGDEEATHSLYEQSLSLLHASQDRKTLDELEMLLISMGDSWLHQSGGEQQAKTLYKQALQLRQDLHGVDDGSSIARGLAGMAEIAVAHGQAERAGRLFGIAGRLLTTAGPPERS